MTANTTTTARAQGAGSRHTEPATAAAVAPANSVANAGTAPAAATTNNRAPGHSASPAHRQARLHSVSPRKRKVPSAEPLAKFRSKGIATWEKAQDYEWDATFWVGQFGLLDVKQLGEWVFKDLSTTAARHRQAQALTLRLCPQARAGSSAQRLATAGHRPVLRTLGRRRIGKRYFHYLNACGLRYMRDNFGLALPDTAESRATTSDMVKRGLLFEHCLTLHRSSKDMELVGPAALSATVDRDGTLAPLERALLTCLSNLWCCIRSHGKERYVYVADRAGSSNGVNVGHYKEVAKAASLLLGRDIGIEVIGRPLPTEAGCALTDTQLARAVVTASAKEVFWAKDKRYRVEKLVAFFVSLKPHTADIRVLMERNRA